MFLESFASHVVARPIWFGICGIWLMFVAILVYCKSSRCLLRLSNEGKKRPHFLAVGRGRLLVKLWPLISDLCGGYRSTPFCTGGQKAIYDMTQRVNFMVFYGSPPPAKMRTLEKGTKLKPGMPMK